MAEKVVVVCDVCGDTATATVAIRAKGQSYQKDLCKEDLSVLLENTRKAVRGRPRKKEGIAA